MFMNSEGALSPAGGRNTYPVADFKPEASIHAASAVTGHKALSRSGNSQRKNGFESTKQ